MNLKHKKILITSGPTWVKIDSMRMLSNQSSGKMGSLLVDALIKKGARVTLVQGPALAPSTHKKASIISFKFFDELVTIINKQLTKKFDIVIHAAAVSDFKPKKSYSSKISSSLKKLTLDLVPTQKIINIFKKKQASAILVGFKLESTLAKAKKASEKLFDNAKCDIIIVNAQQNNNYEGAILSSGNVGQTFKSKQAVVNALVKQLEKELGVKS